MKIAILSAASSIHTVRWANALCARGHGVALFSLSSHPPEPGVYDRRVQIRLLPNALRGGALWGGSLWGGAPLGYWTQAGTLRRALAGLSPDVLNAHYATGYGTLARRCGFRPLLLSVWGSDVCDFPSAGPLHKRLVLRNLSAADAVGSTSRAMAARVRALMNAALQGVAPQGAAPQAGATPAGAAARKTPPIFITPFGVDPAVFCPRPDERPAPGRFTVGTVRALEPKYGIDVLLKAFSLMKARLARGSALPAGGVRLEIYGSGSRLGALRNLADSLGLSDDVTFHGAIPHSRVPNALRRLDVFCAPSVSDSESFCVAAVEAMACGVPTAVSDADGPREVTADGVTGFVVPKRDPVRLGDRLTALARDPALRLRMGAAGRARAVALYSWDGCVRRMEDALAETAALARRAPDGR